MKTYTDAIINLLKVKSLVTILLTATFVYQIVVGHISQEFIMIYSTVIGFYFGTQTKKDDSLGGK
jgi:hypothetical protein